MVVGNEWWKDVLAKLSGDIRELGTTWLLEGMLQAYLKLEASMWKCCWSLGFDAQVREWSVFDNGGGSTSLCPHQWWASRVLLYLPRVLFFHARVGCPSQAKTCFLLCSLLSDAFGQLWSGCPAFLTTYTHSSALLFSHWWRTHWSIESLSPLPLCDNPLSSLILLTSGGALDAWACLHSPLPQVKSLSYSLPLKGVCDIEIQSADRSQTPSSFPCLVNRPSE